MKPFEFLLQHRVFRIEDFQRTCYQHSPHGLRAPERALDYYARRGHISRVRRGLYLSHRALAIAPTIADSFLIASKLAPDAVIAFHSALEFQGLAHTLHNDRTVLGSTKAKGLRHDGVDYRIVPFPVALDTEEKRRFGVETNQASGVSVLVTGLERTLVDLLDRPDLSGGWEEIWRSARGVGFVDPEIMVRHVEHLANATTAARVGWFLEQFREEWMVPEEVLQRLEKLAPRSPRYLLRSRRETGRLVARWNLIVPRKVDERCWEEVL